MSSVSGTRTRTRSVLQMSTADIADNISSKWQVFPSERRKAAVNRIRNIRTFRTNDVNIIAYRR